MSLRSIMCYPRGYDGRARDGTGPQSAGQSRHEYGLALQLRLLGVAPRLNTIGGLRVFGCQCAGVPLSRALQHRLRRALQHHLALALQQLLQLQQLLRVLPSHGLQRRLRRLPCLVDHRQAAPAVLGFQAPGSKTSPKLPPLQAPTVGPKPHKERRSNERREHTRNTRDTQHRHKKRQARHENT